MPCNLRQSWVFHLCWTDSSILATIIYFSAASELGWTYLALNLRLHLRFWHSWWPGIDLPQSGLDYPCLAYSWDILACHGLYWPIFAYPGPWLAPWMAYTLQSSCRSSWGFSLGSGLDWGCYLAWWRFISCRMGKRLVLPCRHKWHPCWFLLQVRCAVDWFCAWTQLLACV